MMMARRCARAFTLVEMLAVITIVVIMLGVMLPALTGLTRGQGMTANAAELNDLVEQAREAALAQNTYVWLGIASIQRDSGPALALTILAGGTGQSTDLANNRYRQVIPTQVLKNVTLDSSGYLTLNGVDAVDNTDFAKSTFSFALKLPGNAANTIFQAIEFKPNGEISLGTPVSRYVGIGLAGFPASVSHPANAAVQVSMLSGQHAIFRP